MTTIEKTKRAANASMEQKNILLEFMKKNPWLLSGKFSDKHTQKDAQKLWEDISGILNSCGNGANKDWKSWRKTWQDIRSRTKSRNSSYQKHKRGTGGGPHLENPNRPFDQEVLDTINTVSLEGHEQVFESATEFVLAYDGENESAEYVSDQRCDIENESTRSVRNDVSRGPIMSDILNAKDDSQKSAKNIVQSNSASTQVKGRQCPGRAPRKKLLYAAEASNNYRISLEKKNEIKSKYYEKKVILLERIATAKERSAAAQEDIANKLGYLAGAVESLQDAIA